MATFAKVRNWRKFQHYTDRKPPWIKLHRELLDDFDYISLPLASKALAPLIWLLAAESETGEVRVDFDWLAFRLRVTEKEAEQGVTPLIQKGFLECDIALLATRYQVATPEREAEAEREVEKSIARPSASRFDEFWSVYPNKKGKKEARDKWERRKLDRIADKIISDVQARKVADKDWLRGYPPHGSTYLNNDGWEDDIPDIKPADMPGASKTMQGIQLLESMKNGLAANRTDDGLPETPLLEFGSPTRR